MSAKDTLKNLKDRFNQASPAGKAGVVGGAMSAVAGGVLLHHFIIVGAIGAGVSYGVTKARGNKNEGPKQ